MRNLVPDDHERLKIEFEFLDFSVLWKLFKLYLLFPKSIATISGWGVVVDQGSSASEYLMTVGIDILNEHYCQSKYDFFLPGVSLCAGKLEGGIDSCNGDSGIQ